MRLQLDLDIGPRLNAAAAAYEAISESAGFWWPGTEVCYVSDRPAELHVVRDDQGVNRLHRDGGPSIRWRDGWSLYHLHGVAVPDWLAISPAESLDLRKVRELVNVEVRREFVRKVGVERILHTLSPGPIDACGEYELHRLDFGDGRPPRPYLRMANPSVPEVWHVEGVDPGCSTVQEALNFRNGLRPSQIDPVSGSDWYQQGDVCLFPAGAKTFKPRPVILT